MIKLIYFTDPHIQSSNPIARLDNFKETIINKLKYVGKLANEEKVDALICGGDIFNRPDNPDILVREIQMLFADFNIPIYSVLGNHDIYGYNPLTFTKTSFGLLDGPRIITRLSMDKPIIIKKDNDIVSLTGCDAHYDLDKNGRILDYIDVPEVDNAIKIHVVHGFLATKSWGDLVAHTVIENILDTKADIILTGHEHSGFDVIRKNGKIFCNPGALARVTAGVGDVNLEVKIALITIDRGVKTVDLIKLPLDIAKPSNEVLNRDKLIEDKKNKEKISSFIQTVSDINTIDSFNIYSVLDSIAKDEKVDDNIIELIKQKLQEAEEQIGKV